MSAPLCSFRIRKMGCIRYPKPDETPPSVGQRKVLRLRSRLISAFTIDAPTRAVLWWRFRRMTCSESAISDAAAESVSCLWVTSRGKLLSTGVAPLSSGAADACVVNGRVVAKEGTMVAEPSKVTAAVAPINAGLATVQIRSSGRRLGCPDLIKRWGGAVAVGVRLRPRRIPLRKDPPKTELILRVYQLFLSLAYFGTCLSTPISGHFQRGFVGARLCSDSSGSLLLGSWRVAIGEGSGGPSTGAGLGELPSISAAEWWHPPTAGSMPDRLAPRTNIRVRISTEATMPRPRFTAGGCPVRRGKATINVPDPATTGMGSLCWLGRGDFNATAGPGSPLTLGAES